MKYFKSKRGFTLIELLAVIIVLAVIMIIAMPSILSSASKAQKAAFVVYSEKILNTATGVYQSEDLVNDIKGTTVGVTTGGSGRYICYTLQQIGISAAGKYYGYVIVNISTSNTLTFMVTLANASFHTYYSTYDNLQLGTNIGDGMGTITSATLCPTTIANASVFGTHV